MGSMKGEKRHCIQGLTDTFYGRVAEASCICHAALGSNDLTVKPRGHGHVLGVGREKSSLTHMMSVLETPSILEPGSDPDVCTGPAHREELSQHSTGVGHKDQEMYGAVQLELDHPDSGVLTGHFQSRRDFQFLREEDGGAPVRPVGVRQVRKNRICPIAFIQRVPCDFLLHHL